MEVDKADLTTTYAKWVSVDNWSSHDVHNLYLRLRNQPEVEELNVRFRRIGPDREE